MVKPGDAGPGAGHARSPTNGAAPLGLAGRQVGKIPNGIGAAVRLASNPREQGGAVAAEGESSGRPAGHGAGAPRRRACWDSSTTRSATTCGSTPAKKPGGASRTGSRPGSSSASRTTTTRRPWRSPRPPRPRSDSRRTACSRRSASTSRAPPWRGTSESCSTPAARPFRNSCANSPRSRPASN